MAVLPRYPDDFQQHLLAHGERIISAISSQKPATDHQHKWLDLLIGRTLSDPEFRIQALRFIDVLPTLDDDQALAEHLQEYFAQLELPKFAAWGLKHTDTPWATRIAAPTVRYTLRGLARKFMGGSQLHHALTSISRLRHQNMNFTLDLLGEATISETESQQYQQQYIDMLEQLADPISNWSQNTFLDTAHEKTSPRLNLSIKLSSLYSQIRTVAPDTSINSICTRLRPILRLAMKQQAFITIDMEQYDLKHIVIGCFKQIIMEDEFRNYQHIGIAIQAYLKESYQDLEQLIEFVSSRGTPVTVRLVRGAYWDYETVIARQNNWPCPVWEYKNDTDFNYEKCLQLLLGAYPVIHTAIATHNPRSIAFAMTLIEQLQLKIDQYEFQMLYGMADYYKHALVSLGYRVRIYVPFGETLPGMAYLVRRLLENSSGQSLLDTGFNNEIPSLDQNIFSAPAPSSSSIQLKKHADKHFFNTPVLRFTDSSERNDFSLQLQCVKNSFGEKHALHINGRNINTEKFISSYSPSDLDLLIGHVASATHKHADLALSTANLAFPDWSHTPVRQRADYLRRVALMLLSRRMEFAALEVYEAGKSWQEADADICEAIDFLNYYAQQAEQMFIEKPQRISGEDNTTSYSPRGVCLVISPWNFPLALLCGMLSAAVVTGNTCIIKPSSLTPVTAAKFMQLWVDTGLPDGVINFLPGPGKIVGEYLARKPDIHIITFTGSLQVGTQLLTIGSQIQPSQHHIKKVISEMGGKNAIVIDSDADLDDAVIGTLQSAFGFQGQKCSAASRVIVVADIYERFVRRLLDAASSIVIGTPEQPENFMGPVIDKNAYDRILQIVNSARYTATLHQTKQTTPTGYYISPCIFTDVDPDSPLAQEEIFGPVLSVLKADSFQHAIELANSTRYALSGGVYSRQPSHLDYASKYFQVGNLYLNRKTTGALVGRHPFGGFNMSGAGSKTGCREYLLQYVNTRCLTENTLRRGFAPEPND